MELRFSPLSPFTRKVRIVAAEAGITDRIRIVPTDTRNRPDDITPIHPLGKVPALVTDHGQVLYASPVICEYLAA